MKRPAVVFLSLFLAVQAMAATVDLPPGQYVFRCPPAPVAKCPDPPLVTDVCRDVLVERDHLQDILTTQKECPQAVEPARGLLQPIQSLADAGGNSISTGLAYVPTAQVKPWYKDWRTWAAVGGGIVLGAVLDHQWDDDEITHVTKHRTTIVERPPDSPEPCHGPPGWCKHH